MKDEERYCLGNDLLVQIAEVLKLHSLQRVVIDIEFGKFVKVFTVMNDAGLILKAIDLESLMKGANITELGVNKEDK